MAAFKAAAFAAILALIVMASKAFVGCFSVIVRRMAAVERILSSMGGS